MLVRMWGEENQHSLLWDHRLVQPPENVIMKVQHKGNKIITKTHISILVPKIEALPIFKHGFPEVLHIIFFLVLFFF